MIILNQTNIDHFMRICINGPEKLSDDELEKLVDIYKNSGNYRIRLRLPNFFEAFLFVLVFLVLKIEIYNDVT